MSDVLPLTPRQRRRATTTLEILDAAWELAYQRGLAGMSMRDLGDRVGLRAQSLYAYFGSKADLFDAMFRQGYVEAVAHLRDRLATSKDRPPRARFTDAAVAHASFCAANPIRYQLLFQRPIPDFVPSDVSYAVALQYLGEIGSAFSEAGVRDTSHLDLGVAVISGLVAQQLANEPGSTRWLGLIPEAVDMFCDHVGIAPDRTDRTTRQPRRST